MKKIIFIIITLAFFSDGVFAQISMSNGNMSATQQTISPDARAKDATDKLNGIAQLSQDQYTKAYQVNRGFFSQSQSMGNGRPAARLATERDQQLKAILTGEQWQMYQNAKAQGQL